MNFEMSLPDGFLKEEFREGILVSEIMKRTWAAQLKMLEQAKDLFDKYGIKYYAADGTALGTVRHKGFIPWDDDIDITMLRKDFMTLLAHADEIAEGLVIRSVYNSDSFMNFHAVITNDVKTLDWDDRRMEDYFGCPFIIYIDVFPMDYVPRNPEKYEVFKELYYMAYKQLYDCRSIEDDYFNGLLVTLEQIKDRESFLSDNSEMPNRLCVFLDELTTLMKYMKKYIKGDFVINEKEHLRHQLCMIVEKVATSCEEADADELYYCPKLLNRKVNRAHRKEWFLDTVDMPFEFTSIKIPQKINDYLTSLFGENYMIPRRGTAGHGYPFFRDEVSVLVGGDTGDNYFGQADDPVNIPGEWLEIFFDEEENKRHIVLYCLSATDVINAGSHGLKHIRKYLDDIENSYDDTLVMMLAPSGLLTFMEKCKLEILSDYEKLIDDLRCMKRVVFDDNPDSSEIHMLLAVADEYYGDICRLSDICKRRDIPVTIQEYSCL